MSKPNTPAQWAAYKEAFEATQRLYPKFSIQDCHINAMVVLAVSDPEHCYGCDRPKADCACADSSSYVGSGCDCDACLGHSEDMEEAERNFIWGEL
jgi:hypothetical protein